MMYCTIAAQKMFYVLMGDGILSLLKGADAGGTIHTPSFLAHRLLPPACTLHFQLSTK